MSPLPEYHGGDTRRTWRTSYVVRKAVPDRFVGAALNPEIVIPLAVMDMFEEAARQTRGQDVVAWQLFIEPYPAHHATELLLHLRVADIVTYTPRPNPVLGDHAARVAEEISSWTEITPDDDLRTVLYTG